MRRILQILIWIVIPIVILVVGILAQNYNENRIIKDLKVDINYRENGEVNRFLTYEDINTFVRHRYDSIKGKANKDVNTEQLEKDLKDIPYVLRADAYSTLDGTIQLRIKQRRALVRVVDLMGDQYYIDEEATIIPIRSFFPARVPVCNGVIPSVEFYTKHHSKPELDSLINNSILIDIYRMARYIDSDSLLRMQIVQMNVDEDGEFTLVPLVSRHIIEFGKAKDIEEKFEKLKVFYKEGLGHHRWNEYKKLNLKYKNQIVCTKY